MRVIPVALVSESTASACGCTAPTLHWSEVYGPHALARRLYFFCAKCRTFGFVAFPAVNWGEPSILDGVSKADLLAAAQWYRGAWRDVYSAAVYTADPTKRTIRRKDKPPQWSPIGGHMYTSEDGGPRLQRSVIYARSEHGRAQNETQKPLAIVSPLIEHSCPPDGVVLSCFAGAGTDLIAAKALGRRAIGIEIREQQCEVAAERLRQGTLNFGAAHG